MIKYRYALDAKGNRVDILNLERANLDKSAKFFSLDYKQELIPRLGNNRAKHFSHKSGTKISGSNETYLHALGKKVFYEEYSKCLTNKTSYNIEYYNYRHCNRLKDEFNIICSLEPETKVFDLTSHFKEIIIEKRNDEFIPDLLISNPDKQHKIYIEIAVTHNLSEEKKNSGNKIIEFSLKNEDDIKQIIDFGKEGHSGIAKYYNFKQTKEIGLFCSEGECVKKIIIFSVSTKGEGELVILNENATRQYINKNIKNNIWHIKELYEYEYYEGLFSKNKIKGDLFLFYLAKSYKQKINVKNCLICQYHRKKMNWQERKTNQIFCKFLKKECHSNEAINCQYFRIEKTYINEYSITPYSDEYFNK